MNEPLTNHKVTAVPAGAKALAHYSLQRSLVLSGLPVEEPFSAVYRNWRTHASFCHINALAAGNNELWATTWGGIVKWRFEDGSRTTFTRFSSEHGLPGARFQCIALDAYQRPWVGGPRVGLSTFDGERWRTLTTDHGLPSNNILCVSIDDLGRVWAGTSRGVGYVKEINGEIQWHQYSLEGSGLPAGEVNALLIDADESLWLGTDWGLYHVQADGISRRYAVADGLPALQITQLQRASDCLWIGTVAGLCQLNKEGIQKVPRVTESIWSMDLDPSALSVWLVMPSGVYTYKPETGLEKVNLFPAVRPDAEARVVAIDPAGKQWLGYLGSVTLASAPRALMSDEGFDSMTRGENSLSNCVSSVCADAVGRIWVGTPEGVWYLEDGIWRKCLPEQLGGSLVNVRGIALAPQSKDLWISGWCDNGSGGGICRMLGTTGIPFVGGAPEMPYVDALVIDSAERVWAAAAGSIVSFDGKAWTFLPALPEEYSGEVIRCLAVDRDNALWCGTTDGLWRFDGQWRRQEIDAQVATVAFTEHEMWIGTPDGLKCRGLTAGSQWQDVIPEIKVTTIVSDHHRDLWVGTESGLLHLQDGDQQTITVENSGLADNFVQALHLDNQTLWIGTANGLSRLTIN